MERFRGGATPDGGRAVDGGLDRHRGLTREQLVARAAVAGGALTAAGVLLGGLPRSAESKPSHEQDRRILEWLLQIEYLQSAFYTAAERRGALRGELQEYAARVGKQERDHVAALRNLLGPDAPAQPKFDFKDATSNPDRFLAAALDLEEIAVAAFNGQIPNLTRPRVMTAMRIVSVEARHAGWVRDLAHKIPAPQPADHAATQAETRAAMKATGFTE